MLIKASQKKGKIKYLYKSASTNLFIIFKIDY